MIETIYRNDNGNEIKLMVDAATFFDSIHGHTLNPKPEYNENIVLNKIVAG